MEVVNDIKKIVTHIDKVGNQLNDENNKNDEKIKMYNVMIENIIDEYFELCRKMYD